MEFRGEDLVTLCLKLIMLRRGLFLVVRFPHAGAWLGTGRIELADCHELRFHNTLGLIHEAVQGTFMKPCRG